MSRKRERKLTYRLSSSTDSEHCSGINSLQLTSSNAKQQHLFTASRDGTIKRWALNNGGQRAPQYEATFGGHVDWVNSIALVSPGNSQVLCSCSSDGSIKLWDAAKAEGKLVGTMYEHSDYVISLAASEHKPYLVSGGLGGEVFLWDLSVVQTQSSLGTQREVEMRKTKGHKESVYSVAINSLGTLAASGSTDQIIRLWDVRSGEKAMKLRGHNDNIRALVLDKHGKYLLSGSSDRTVRLWDLGQQRCVQTFAMHTGSVWAIEPTSRDSFSSFISGGSDNMVYRTSLSTRESELLLKEEYPVLDLAISSKEDCVWVATTSSSINQWALPSKTGGGRSRKNSAVVAMAGNLPPPRSRNSTSGDAASGEDQGPSPLITEPVAHGSIGGSPGLIRHEILNDKIHVLTLDSQKRVVKWNVLTGLLEEAWTDKTFDDVLEEVQPRVSVPTWFSADTRLGCLSITMEPPQCFAAEVYAADLDPQGDEEEKCNLGAQVLQGLLSIWLRRRNERNPGPRSKAARDSDSTKNSVNSSQPPDELSGEEPGSEATSGVKEKKEMSAFVPFPRELPTFITQGRQGWDWVKPEQMDGTEGESVIPVWCLDCVLRNNLLAPPPQKYSFYLSPVTGCGLPQVTSASGQRLHALPVLRVKKMVAYVVNKLNAQKDMATQGSSEATSPSHKGEGSGSFVGSLSRFSFRRQDSLASGSKKSSEDPAPPEPKQESMQFTEDDIEILCNEEVLALQTTLATVRAFIWKKPGDVQLEYRPRRPNP